MSEAWHAIRGKEFICREGLVAVGNAILIGFVILAFGTCFGLSVMPADKIIMECPVEPMP